MKRLVRRIAETAIERLGSCLILELWSGEDRTARDAITGEILLPRPAFRIFTRRPHRPGRERLPRWKFALQQVRLHRKAADVRINMHAQNHPAGMTPLLSETVETKIGCYVLGLEVRPVFRDPKSGEVYDRVAVTFRRQVSHCSRKRFLRSLESNGGTSGALFLARSSRLPKQVLTIDRQLAELSSQFKFLLLVTPINAERAWNDFSESGYPKTPVFQYRPLDADPLLLKRRLMKIATERVDDPTLSTCCGRLNTNSIAKSRCSPTSEPFGFCPAACRSLTNVKPKLRDLAGKILQTLADRELNRSRASRMLSAKCIRAIGTSGNQVLSGPIIQRLRPRPALAMTSIRA